MDLLRISKTALIGWNALHHPKSGINWEIEVRYKKQCIPHSHAFNEEILVLKTSYKGIYFEYHKFPRKVCYWFNIHKVFIPHHVISRF